MAAFGLWETEDELNIFRKHTKKMTSSEKFSRPSFGGHEKFVFRQGWLKKGVDFSLRDPAFFKREDCFVELGVGKNMASAIRYWGLTLNFLQESEEKTGEIYPTQLGRSLLSEGGWDPYLENIGTLWLIHWQLASNQRRGLVWYLVFSRYYEIEFRKELLMEFLERQFAYLGIQTTLGMIEREVDVFLRTYTSAHAQKTSSPEEKLDCPLVDLNLIQQNERVYRFNIGRKTSLPAEIFGFALFEFLRQRAATRSTALVDECIYQPGSPGQLFKLDENSALDYLETLESLTNGNLRVRETAGQQQLFWQDISPSKSWELLQSYYE